jgi:uncharacterized protein (DUF3084 family)
VKRIITKQSSNTCNLELKKEYLQQIVNQTDEKYSNHQSLHNETKMIMIGQSEPRGTHTKYFKKMQIN